ncbi:ras GEF [Xylariaceae sp. AK1471]|nr:ras GEF [Xylariaceae sp. AK1471]
MEVDPIGLHPPLPVRSNLSLRQNPKRNASTRDQKLQTALGQDARTTRSPTYARAAEKIRPGVRTSPIAGSKPLIPASERRSGEQAGNKVRKSPTGEKWSPSVEGGTVGREGRHFTVANVGNNGQIFLRPIARPDNQRYPQPPVAFPVTPPSTAGLDALSPKRTRPEETSELNNSQWTPTPMTDSPSPNRIPRSAYFDVRLPSNHHRRAVSDSTAQDVTMGPEGSDAGVFKVVISKPQNAAKSKTAEDLDSENGPFLQVSIPSWKLGTPRFTLRGTPLIRGSSYAPTEDMRSNHASLKPSPREKTNNLLRPETLGSRIASFRSSQSQYASPAWPVPAGDTPSSSIAKPSHPGFMPANLIIEPAMFDALTFKPACDDRSIVRYSQNTKAVTAATPPRLVAEITSPSFLDYDLISDFFLTFRSFLDASDLLRLLIARLRWALSQDDESGMIVKVRTFVAIRHWILNYFVDDFVVDYHLRVTFCDLLNDFTDELPTSQSKQKVPFKIVGELKKCWRRVCAQYWDGPEFNAELGHDVPITPGGIAGHRDPSLTPSFWETEFVEAPQLDSVPMQIANSHQDTSSSTNVSKVGQADTCLRSGVRPSTPDKGTIHSNQQPASPTSPMSIASLDVVSCSFPTKALRIGDPNTSMSLGAHPADPSSIYTSADPIAPTPRALIGKRVRPQTSHRRNNSMTDSLREHGTITEKVLFKNAEFLLTLPYAGSLVRGNLLPPGQPFVDLDGAASKGGSRQTTVFQPQSNIVTKGKASASAMSSQGMRKLLGSVRRALSTRGLGISQGQGSFIDIAPIGPRGATTNRLPGTAVVPQARYSHLNGTKQPFRIDMLGARIAEDFKQAVREDTAETKSATMGTRSLAENVAENVEYSAAHLDSSFELRPLSDAAITTGSKSIVIVDGTAPPEHFFMTGALPPFNPSVETFADSMIHMHGRDPTPPMTPPSDRLRGNTPRRSSYILGQHVYAPSLSSDPLPPLDMTQTKVVGIHDMTVPSRDASRATKSPVNFVNQSSKKPPSSYLGRHKRQQSSRSYRSRGSLSQRRWASFHSGIAAHSTAQSFDATTYSEGSIKSEIMPPPLRMLRRKPGGDLRGAANTAQLDPLPIRRSRSIGSLTAYSDSLRSSYIRSPIRDSSGFVDIVSSDYSQNRVNVFSLGAVAEQAPKRPPSLFSTHSSKPIMRPSFEAEAQKLAQIPDDVDDDGGVESALLKLEGKYERKAAKLSIEPLKIPSKDLQNLSAEPVPSVDDGQAKEDKKKHRHLHVGEDEVPAISPIDEDSATGNMTQIHMTRRSEISSFLSEDSMETYNSIPLLDRGLTDEGRSRTHTREWANHSILEGPDTPVEEVETPVATSSLHPSFEFISRTESMERAIERPLAVNPSEDRSFLDIESDNDSELSSELSAEIIDGSNHVPRPLSSNQVEGRYITPHPNGTSEIGFYLDDDASSLKLTLVQALQMSPDTANIPEVHEHQLWSQKPLPPTPDTTPTTALYHKALGSPSDLLNSRQTLGNATKLAEETTEQPTLHLPFILAFDSEILAQQFTLIEKDALNEVDWKELIEMKWKDSHNDSRSWVDFLRNTDARGVEVVIARFNIMVKWAISEIVLTQDLEERARCIIKLLHIAAHCRKYRNFATMSQITIALTSNEVGRLSRTWAMVPPTDMKTMSDLETLVSPTKNFYNLRAEMESGGSAVDTGCIPFVGIYTHDLLFNSQRPSEIASSPTTPPLVNFERCRISASIVKTLLRLLEASTYYQFQPIEGITERCLWMGALGDDEIRKRSESLE